MVKKMGQMTKKCGVRGTKCGDEVGETKCGDEVGETKCRDEVGETKCKRKKCVDFQGLGCTSRCKIKWIPFRCLFCIFIYS